MGSGTVPQKWRLTWVQLAMRFYVGYPNGFRASITISKRSEDAMKIMIVEDDRTIASILAAELTKWDTILL